MRVFLEMSRKYFLWEMHTWGPKDMGSYPAAHIGTKHLQNWQSINLFLPQYRNEHCRETWTCNVQSMRVNGDEVYISNCLWTAFFLMGTEKEAYSQVERNVAITATIFCVNK